MAADYEQSDRVEEVAKELIQLYHQHLSSAKIAYLMKLRPEDDKPMKPPRPGKHPKMAVVKAVTAQYKCLTGFDFVIEVDEVHWDKLTLDGQTALVDHELCHCARDVDGLYLIDYDVEEFIQIIRRHGYWRNGLVQFVEAAQAKLPFDEVVKESAAAGPVQ